jgi:hypothetical protein
MFKMISVKKSNSIYIWYKTDELFVLHGVMK